MTDQELADELRHIADHPYVDARSDQLRDLADAIIDSRWLIKAGQYDVDSPPEPTGGSLAGKAERWCEVDLFSAFAPDDTLIVEGAGPALSRDKSWILKPGAAALGSVLVFLPIITTWFGLMRATGAYGATLDASGPEAARRPFLEMWQQGFDGRLPLLLRFDYVAMFTLGVVLFLILWTAGEHYARNRHEDKSEQELARLRARLRAALTQATLVLSQVRLSSPARFTVELTRAATEIRQIGSTARKVQNDLSKSLTQALETTEKVSESLVASATDVQGAVEALDGHLTDINATWAEMTTSIRQTTAVIETTGAKAEQAIVAAGDHLSTTVSTTTLKMGEAVGHELAQSTRAVQEVIATLDSRVAALDTRIEALDTRMAAIDAHVGALGTRAGEFVTAAARIEAAVNDARVSVSSSTARTAELFGKQMSDTLSFTASEFRETFGSTSTDIRETLGNTSIDIRATLGNTSLEIREALGDWAVIAGAHAHRVEVASDASGRTVTVLEETRDVLDQLPAALDRLPAALDSVLSNLPMRIKELTDGEFAELKYAINHLESAVHRAAEVLSTPVPTAISVIPASAPNALGESSDVLDAASELPNGGWSVPGAASGSLSETQ